MAPPDSPLELSEGFGGGRGEGGREGGSKKVGEKRKIIRYTISRSGELVDCRNDANHMGICRVMYIRIPTTAICYESRSITCLTHSSVSVILLQWNLNVETLHNQDTSVLNNYIPVQIAQLVAADSYPPNP